MVKALVCRTSTLVGKHFWFKSRAGHHLFRSRFCPEIDKFTLGSRPTEILWTGNADFFTALWRNWITREALTFETLGSYPSGATKCRCRYELKQESVLYGDVKPPCSFLITNLTNGWNNDWSKAPCVKTFQVIKRRKLGNAPLM